MRFRSDAVQRFVTAIFAAAGSSETEAEAIAEHLVEANLRGHDSHGVARIIRYIGYLRDGDLVPNQAPEWVLETDTLLIADGGLGYGQSVGAAVVARGIAAARRSGVALVGLRNVGHLGRIGAWAEQAAAAGQVSIHWVNTSGLGMLVAPFGGRDARMSTNPIAIGVPRDGRPPLIFDAATSFVAEGKVFVAANKGTTVPEGALLDADGVPTLDPQSLYAEPRGAIRAFGLHKGSGLAFMTDILAGVLTGGGCSAPGVTRLANAMLSIFIDPAALTDVGAMNLEVERFTAWVKASPPLEPGGAVLVPGEPELAARAERLADGLPLDDTTWRSIIEAAGLAGVSEAEFAKHVTAAEMPS